VRTRNRAPGHPGTILKRLYLDNLETAADPVFFCRHFGEKEHLVYKKTGEIEPEKWTRFVNKVRLPGNKTGEFKKDAFNKAVHAVISMWDKLLLDMKNQNPAGCPGYLKNWNLDTGIDEDRADFWV